MLQRCPETEKAFAAVYEGIDPEPEDLILLEEVLPPLLRNIYTSRRIRWKVKGWRTKRNESNGK
jgi:hypothetical protein